MKFGTVIRGAREHLGMSLSGLAKELGVTKMYVSDVERGLRAPFTRKRLIAASDALGLDPVKLHELAADHRGYARLPVDTADKTKNRLAAMLSHRWMDLGGEQVSKIMGAL